MEERERRMSRERERMIANGEVGGYPPGPRKKEKRREI